LYGSLSVNLLTSHWAKTTI